MPKISKNKIYNFVVNNFSFGSLSSAELVSLFKDGRYSSPFMELMLTHWFPELRHVTGCKGYDHVDKNNQKYDAKNFTQTGGLKFMPSNQMGSGRKFCFETTRLHAQDLIYICCDIVDFPNIRVVFKDGADLLREYPAAKVSKTKREELFRE